MDCRETARSNDGHAAASPNTENPETLQNDHLAIQLVSSPFCNLMVCFVQLFNVAVLLDGEGLRMVLERM